MSMLRMGYGGWVMGYGSKRMHRVTVGCDLYPITQPPYPGFPP